MTRNNNHVNPHATTQARDRMLDALDRKMTKAVGHRGDMHVGDFSVIDQTSGRILIGYETNLGPVTSSDVTSFIARQFAGRIIPVMETAKLHKSAGAVEILIHRTVPTRRLEDSQNMLAVASTMFIDQQLGDTWEVKSHADGTKFLARVAKDNINDIVAERRRRMSIHASTVTFSNALSAGVPNLNRGDEVRFYADSQIHEGKITKAGADVVIQSATGTYTVSPEAVVEIMRVSPETTSEIKSYLGEYYSDAYGFEDYGQQLTRELV